MAEPTPAQQKQILAEATVRYAISRSWLRYTVVRITEFPHGLHGIRIKPFRHPERSFWRYRAAVAYAEARKAKREDDRA